MFLKQITVGSMGVCCYIVGCSKTSLCAVIDPGGDEDTILEEVKKAGLTIDSIIATHGHPDHVCGNRILKEASGADIIMHEADSAFFSKPEVQNYFSMLGLEPSPPADRTVKDGDVITVGEEELLVIHTPGHTPGGICLYCAPDLITGDSLFVGGIGRTDFPGGSHDELIRAIKGRLLSLPPETVVWPGHGYGGSRSTIEEEARSNPYLS
ncbi:Zn-dependent hydrolase, glyoxylase [Desulfocapsa sulfexigens DSM 10523]|uniref:Zn-dependent hydrolase, glyoxylase n=1 Tax=Desulfocapsa sulfexigens (strain DSM 10523 / SB164P1) TaxID=1167006 RepID=M1PQR9_DESSD|nr:MBL fold metallo-hydrolase [Desulfocapsa sulfexigens]AGF78746.1 Zn-dependent hydrolase, glyoxylase [Desulfocapsa sulfexigens DSM 10523]